MSTNLSVKELLSHLESRIVRHRERSAFHAQHEALHREQREQHDAELDRLSRLHEAFRSSSSEAAELALQDRVLPQAAEEDLAAGSRPQLTRMVTRIVKDKALHERFGTAAMTREVQERYGKWLRRPVRAHRISIILRRLAAQGSIHLARRGRPHWEALYTRERPEREK
jgi:hypothetical protein